MQSDPVKNVLLSGLAGFGRQADGAKAGGASDGGAFTAEVKKFIAAAADESGSPVKAAEIGWNAGAETAAAAIGDAKTAEEGACPDTVDVEKILWFAKLRGPAEEDGGEAADFENEYAELSQEEKRRMGDELLSHALKQIAAILGLPEENDAPAAFEFNPANIEQLAAIMAYLDLTIKMANDRIDVSANAESANMAMAAYGMESPIAHIEPEQNAAELSEFAAALRTEKFRLDMAFRLIGVSGMIAEQMAEHSDAGAATGIPQAVNPAELGMSVADTVSAFSNLIREELAASADRVRQIARGQAEMTDLERAAVELGTVKSEILKAALSKAKAGDSAFVKNDPNVKVNIEKTDVNAEDVKTEVKADNKINVNKDINAEVKANAKADVNAAINAGVDTEVKADTGTANVKADVNTTAKADVSTSNVKIEVNTGVVNAAADTDADTAAKADTANTKTGVNKTVNTDVKADAEVDTGAANAKADVNTDVKTVNTTNRANRHEQKSVNIGVNATVKTDAKADVNTGVNTGVNTTVNTDVKADADTGVNTAVNTKVDTNASPEAKVSADTADVKTNVETDVNTKVNADVSPKAKVDTDTANVKPDVDADADADVDADKNVKTVNNANRDNRHEQKSPNIGVNKTVNTNVDNVVNVNADADVKPDTVAKADAKTADVKTNAKADADTAANTAVNTADDTDADADANAVNKPRKRAADTDLPISARDSASRKRRSSVESANRLASMSAERAAAGAKTSSSGDSAELPLSVMALAQGKKAVKSAEGEAKKSAAEPQPQSQTQTPAQAKSAIADGETAELPVSVMESASDKKQASKKAQSSPVSNAKAAAKAAASAVGAAIEANKAETAAGNKAADDAFVAKLRQAVEAGGFIKSKSVKSAGESVTKAVSNDKGPSSLSNAASANSAMNNAESNADADLSVDNEEPSSGGAGSVDNASSRSTAAKHADKADAPSASQDERLEVIRQISEKMNNAVRAGANEIRMTLRPEALGEVRMSLRIQGDVVFARMQVENKQVKSIVESSLQSLKDSLNRQNLEFGAIDVEVGAESDGGKSPRELWQEMADRAESRGFRPSVGVGPDGMPIDAGSDGFVSTLGSDTGRRFGDNTFEYFA